MDENGAELISGIAKKDFSAVLISCPALETGVNYTVTAGDYSTPLTMDTLVYGAGGGGGGGGHWSY